MTYQPTHWKTDLLPFLLREPIDVVSCYEALDLEGVERACVDRLAAIISDVRRAGLGVPTALDLGCSAGFLSMGLAMALGARCTAVEDDRYIDVQGESEECSAQRLRDRLQELGVTTVQVVEDSVEHFLQERSSLDRHDLVLCLNVLHHLATGYGRLTDAGRLEPQAFRELLKSLGDVTGKRLYVEVNSRCFDHFDGFLGDVVDLGRFRHCSLLCRSVAADGDSRILWVLTR